LAGGWRQQAKRRNRKDQNGEQPGADERRRGGRVDDAELLADLRCGHDEWKRRGLQQRCRQRPALAEVSPVEQCGQSSCHQQREQEERDRCDRAAGCPN
jgi:hypothetical protein